MAEFTPDVQGPQNTWMIGKGAEAPKSLLGEIGGIVSGAADKGLDIYKQYKTGELEASEGGELSQTLRDYANGGQNQGPSLVGETTPAQSDPGFQAAKSEIDKHSAAAAQGAPGAKQALLTRLSEIQSRYAAQNPMYAPQLAEYAKGVLGFSANEQLYSAASQAEDFQRSLTQGAQKALFDKGVEAGGIHYNADGSPDIQQTMLNGQKILVQEQQQKAALAEAQVASAQAKPALTQDQITDQEFRIGRPVATQITQAATNGLFSQFSGILKTYQDGKPIDQTVVANTVATAKARAEFQVDQWADKNNLGFQSRQNLKSYVDSEFAPFQTIMGQDLTSAKQLSIAIERLKSHFFLDFAKVAPHTAAAVTIGGPQAAGALLQSYTGPGTSTPVWKGMAGEMDKYFSSSPDFASTAKAVNGIMAGKYDLSQEQDPNQARAVAQTVMPMIETLPADPSKMDTKTQAAFGSLVHNVSKAAVVGGDSQTVLNAAPRLTAPQTVQGLIKFADNPANANKAPETMAYYGQYLAKVQEEGSKALGQGGDVRIQAGPQTRFSVPMAQVHYSATVTATGAVPTFTAKDEHGQVVTLTPAQQRQVLSMDPNFGRVLQSYNQAVKADATIRSALKEPTASVGERASNDAKAELPHLDLMQAEPDQQAMAVNRDFSRQVTEIFPGAKVTSGYRTAEENKKAGGSESSMHRHAQAIDFDAPGQTKAQVLASLKARGLPVTELLDAHDEARLGYGHMGPNTFHWGWGPKETKVASR